MKINHERERQMERSRNFFDWLSKYYDRGPLNFWLTGILKRVLSEVKIKRKSKILDAGCGTGNLFRLLSPRKDLQFYGIDTSPKMLEIADRKLAGRAKLKLQPVEEIKEKNKFDYIFSSEAFHHYSNHHKAMENFYQALKKNGKLIIIDFDFGRALNCLFNKVEPGNSKTHTAEELRNLFKQHNFKWIRQKRFSLAVLTEGAK